MSNVYLIGMPGCGKSTVAKILAASLGADIYDTDALIVERHGEINKIFENHGEEYFRNLESAVIEEVALKQNAVISTGGGCVIRIKNVQNLKKSGKTVYLRTTLNVLLKRTEGDGARPLLRGEREEKLKNLLAARARLYEDAADYTVDTDGLTPEETAKKITEFLK